MAKLKALPSRLIALRSGLGGLPPVERTRDEDRALHSPWRKLYKTARWRALRMSILARDLFTCQWPGCGFSTADTSKLVADHREPHRGDEELFWSPANLWCLCAPCHNSRKQRQERRSGR
ncbi:MAG: HNH endonuclease [Lysobacteraceae bacterium]|nr:MAG: HNH endonuclease [Xanthomonadaceae bacterium]